MTCTCAIPDSFNVRVSDLVNPRCPVHGTKLIDTDVATEGELVSLFQEHVYEAHTPAIVRDLLARYDIRGKQ
jgi:hypothetical protein